MKKSNSLEHHFVIKNFKVSENKNIKINLNSSTTESIGGHNWMAWFLTLQVCGNLFLKLQSYSTFNFMFLF